jgi:hypothetical protein
MCVEGRLQGLTAGMNMLQLFRENRGEYTHLRGGCQGHITQRFREVGVWKASKRLNISEKFS